MADSFSWQTEVGKKAVLSRLKNPEILFPGLFALSIVFLSLAFLLGELSRELGIPVLYLWIVAITLFFALGYYSYRYNRIFFANKILRYGINQEGITLNGVFTLWSDFVGFQDEREQDLGFAGVGLADATPKPFVIQLLRAKSLSSKAVLLFMPDEKTYQNVRSLVIENLKCK